MSHSAALSFLQDLACNSQAKSCAVWLLVVWLLAVRLGEGGWSPGHLLLSSLPLVVLLSVNVHTKIQAMSSLALQWEPFF